MFFQKWWFLKVSVPVFVGFGFVFGLISYLNPTKDASAEAIANDNQRVIQTGSSSSIIPIGDRFVFYDGGDDYSIAGKPAIQSDGENFLAVWMNNNTWEIMASRVNTVGVRLDNPALVLSQASSIGVNPSVGFDGTNYLVVWVSCGAGVYDWLCTGDIYAARVTQDGIILDPGGVKITTGSDALARKLGIAYDGINYLVVWRTYGMVVRGTRVSASGGPPTNLDDSNGFQISEGSWSRYPSVEYGEGIYLVAWHKGECGDGNQSIQAARVYTDGTVLDPANFIVNDGNGCQAYTVVGWDGQNFQVSWINWYLATGKRYASGSISRVTTDALILDSPAITLSNYIRSVDMACSDQDCLYTWDVEHDPEFNSRLTDSYAKRIDQSGNVIDEQPAPIATSALHQWGPMAARNNNDRYLVLWDDRRDTGGARAIIGGQILQRVAQESSSAQITEIMETVATTWTEEILPGSGAATTSGFALSEDVGYAFGNKNFQYKDGAWSDVYPPGSKNYKVWAIADEIWSGGTCRSISHFDGTNWSMDCWDYTGDDGVAISTYGIWGQRSDQLWASTDHGHILRYNPYHPWIVDGWQYMDTPTKNDLYDLWGSKWYNMLAVGDRGTVIRYDGDTWSLLDNVPTIQSLNAIWGYAANHVFVVGDWGTILHFNGITWTVISIGTTEHLVDIWGRNPNDIYIVGLHGTLLHFDGSTWTIEDTDHDVDFLSVWGHTTEISGTRSVWIGTRSNLVLKKTSKSATFLADPTSGFAPITTVFTNTSASGYTSVLWDFGDGVTSTVDSPTHTYTTNGAYTVTLDVTWPDGGDTAFKPNLINVYEYEPVSVSFTVSPTIGVYPLTVWFTGTVDGDYDQVLWDFGDGLTGTQRIISHTYDYGYYDIFFSAQGPGGLDRAFQLNQITVKSPAGGWFDANPLNGFEPLTVTFNGGCSGEYETGSFDYGDGDVVSTTSFNLEHTYTAPGVYTATSTCIGPWNTGTWEKTINVLEMNKVFIPLVFK